MPRFWQLPSCFIHCGGTEYRLRYVGLLGVYTLYKGLRKAASTTDFVKTPLINYNKYDHMFRLDIKLPSDHSNICTQRKQHNHMYILINKKYEGLYVMQLPLCMLLWHEDSLMSNRNMQSYIFNRINCFDGPDFLNHYIHLQHVAPHAQRMWSSQAAHGNCTLTLKNSYNYGSDSFDINTIYGYSRI